MLFLQCSMLLKDNVDGEPTYSALTLIQAVLVIVTVHVMVVKTINISKIGIFHFSHVYDEIIYRFYSF